VRLRYDTFPSGSAQRVGRPGQGQPGTDTVRRSPAEPAQVLAPALGRTSVPAVMDMGMDPPGVPHVVSKVIPIVRNYFVSKTGSQRLG
jgi:hypothetical protein